MRVLIVDMVLDGHLIDVDTLLDTELGNNDIEGGIEHAHNRCRSNDGAVAHGEIVDEQAEEEVGTLLLCQLGSIFLDVALLRDLGHSLAIDRELVRVGEHGLELTMHHQIGIAANGRGEVRVDGSIERVVVVLGDVDHAGAEVLGFIMHW